MTAAEKNAHYGMLNARFEERFKLLRELGFNYETIPVLDIAVFTKKKYGKFHTIAASKVICADDVVWGDTLESAIRFANS